MKKVLIKFIVFCALVFIISGNAALAASELTLLPDDDQKVEKLLGDQLKKKLKRGAFFVLGIEEKLKNSRGELKMLRDNLKLLENKISDNEIQIQNLNGQMQNLDRLIENNSEKINAVRRLIAANENTITRLEDEIKEKGIFLKQRVGDLDKTLTSYYLQNNLFFDSSGEADIIALLSSGKTTGEILRENDYLFFLQETAQKLAREIIIAQDQLDEKTESLDERKEQLIRLQQLLSVEEKSLRESQESKKRLLQETQGKQAIYETLLDISKKEIEQVSEQIERLKENYAFFEIRLAELKNLPEAKNIIFDGEFDEDDAFLKGAEPLSWPVSPSLGLSALFHDSAYEKTLGVSHEGVDIRIIQGSKVKTAADGVVTKVADNGYAYSYVIIAHPNNILTLYGHLSEILVEEGEIVRQGQTIGLSGGIPGTKGAGWLTTGAHLHFEVFKDFKRVDPLDYLPLEYVPVNSLPEKYLKRLAEGQEEKVKRTPVLE